MTLGMLQSGVSRQLFERWCEDERNGVVLAGYSVEGTLAKKLLSEPEEITCLDGRIKKRNCAIEYISFSAHVDYIQNTRSPSPPPSPSLPCNWSLLIDSSALWFLITSSWFMASQWRWEDSNLNLTKILLGLISSPTSLRPFISSISCRQFLARGTYSTRRHASKWSPSHSFIH
jgi:hypothetical protein